MFQDKYLTKTTIVNIFKTVSRITLMFHFMRKRCKRGTRKSSCSGCGIEVEESRKGQRYCKSCHAENMRRTRKKHSELKPEARLKTNCRAYANVYIRRGILKKQPCIICGEKAQMHHDDYSKPLEVIWFCRKHHLEHHKKLKENNTI